MGSHRSTKRPTMDMWTSQHSSLLLTVTLQDQNVCTTLHFTAQNGRETVTEQILASRCNVAFQLREGVTPLHVTSRKGHATVARQFIVASSNVDLQTKKGHTPRKAVAVLGHVNVSKIPYCAL